MRNDILVSIVTPAYNAEAFIAGTIDSVREQSYPNWEMLIVDDCSTDSTSEIVHSFLGQDSRIRYLKTSYNSGKPSVAKNIALKKLNGEYIAFLDSDDLWLPEKLEKQLSAMKKEGADFCYSGGEWIDETGKIIKEFMPCYPSGRLFPELLRRYEINNQSVLFWRSLLKKLEIPQFDESITIGEDYHLFMRLAVHANMLPLRKKLVKYRIHSGSIRKRSPKKLYEGTEKAVKELKRLYPKLATVHAESFQKAEAKVGFYKAYYWMEQNSGKQARKELKPYRHNSIVYLMLYVLTYTPFLWKKALKILQR